MKDPLVIGKITGPFGIKGWVKIHSFTDPEENLFHYPQLYLKRRDSLQAITFTAFKPHNIGYVAQCAQIPDRTAAELVNKVEILVDRSDLPETEADEYYWVDMVGMTVVNQDNEALGQVDRVFNNGANDVLVVQDDRRERLLPFVKDQVIIKVDMTNRLIKVDWEADF